MPALYLRLFGAPVRDDEGAWFDFDWALLDDDGNARGHGSTDTRALPELIDAAASWASDPANIIVLVPNTCVLTVSCDVPGRSAAQVKKALPYVVEEHVATDVDGLHIAHGPIRRGEGTQCTVIERVLLAEWLAILAEAGVAPGYFIAEAELLPLEEGGMTVLFDGATVLVRTAEQSAVLDVETLPVALAALVASLGDAAEPSLRQIGGVVDPIELAQLDPPVASLEDPFGGSAFEYLIGRCRSGGLASAVNLLQGDFQPKRKADPRATQWQSTALLAAIALVLGLVTMSARAWWADHRADVLQEETLSLFQSIFPGAKQVRNVRRALAQRLGQRVPGNTSGFLPLVGELSSALAAAGVTIQVRSLNFREAQGELTTEIVLDSIDRVETIRGALQSAGLAAEMVSADQQSAGGFRVRLRIKDV